MRKDGVGDAKQEHALKRQRLLGTRASEREIVESDVQLGNSCLGFYLNQMDVVDDGRNGAHAPYVVSLAELFQDGRLLRGCSSGTCPVSRSGPSSDGAAPRRVSREPFPGITDALLANFVADYDASFFFDQCPSLYQTTGQLVLITGDAPSRIAALRGWVRDHLQALAERTRVLGVSGLFSGRAPSACEQGPDSLSARVDGAGGGGGGVHHSKFMILRLRDDRVRLVIHTSNDIAYDWFFKCQGIFAVDLPLRGAGSASPNTGFCADLQQYLGAYIRAGERALHGGVTSARRFGTMVAPGDASGIIGARLASNLGAEQNESNEPDRISCCVCVRTSTLSKSGCFELAPMYRGGPAPEFARFRVARQLAFVRGCSLSKSRLGDACSLLAYLGALPIALWW